MESLRKRPKASEVCAIADPPSSARRRWMESSVGILSTAMLSWSGAGLAGYQDASREEDVRRIRFTITLRNPLSRMLQNQRFWCYLPASEDSVQRLLRTEVSMPYRVLTDASGHNLLELDFPEFAPLAQVIVGLSVDVKVRSEPEPHELRGNWLGAERFIESDDPQLVALARQLKADSPLASAQAIYEWVAANIAYAGYLEEDYGAVYGLTRRRGDCTEFAYLTVALARAAGIPARMVGGYVLTQHATPRQQDYHNWAQVYVDGAWRLMDAQKKNWLTPAEQSVAVRFYRARSINAIGLAHRFRVDGDLLVQI